MGTHTVDIHWYQLPDKFGDIPVLPADEGATRLHASWGDVSDRDEVAKHGALNLVFSHPAQNLTPRAKYTHSASSAPQAC